MTLHLYSKRGQVIMWSEGEIFAQSLDHHRMELTSAEYSQLKANAPCWIEDGKLVFKARTFAGNDPPGVGMIKAKLENLKTMADVKDVLYDLLARIG